MSTRKTVPVILEYCGGKRTDALYEALCRSNRCHDIEVLDNASPRDQSRYVTVRNLHNSFVGGGIRDCIALAERKGAEYLFFICNDIQLIRVPNIEYFESLAARDESVVLVGAAITEDSHQAGIYPWMVNRRGKCDRISYHYDPLCCLIRISFIREFGGFPPSEGGWGYDWEFASYARFRRRKLIISDSAVIHHEGDASLSQANAKKWYEMRRIYDELYGDYRLLLAWQISGYVPGLKYQFGLRPGPALHKRRLSDEQLQVVLECMQNEITFDRYRA